MAQDGLATNGTGWREGAVYPFAERRAEPNFGAGLWHLSQTICAMQQFGQGAIGGTGGNAVAVKNIGQGQLKSRAIA